MDLAAKTAAALLEYERLGRLSTTTRDGLTEALDDVAGGRVVEIDDDDQGATKATGRTSKGASK
jgi:hypothetical protein